ncbi:OV-16 antigen isoform X2 [Bemisia tabaci]|uniref:OV-16 antigen isoform X2 n=1 Tax=Bemisia tabaci TaxID=7038 RepID=UPI003B28B6A5
MLRINISWVFQLQNCMYFLFASSVLPVRSTSTVNTVIPPLVTKTAKEIEKALLKHEIIPDVINKAPKHFLMALFRENDEMPELGNVLDPNYLDWYPYLLNWPCDNTSLYTLVMTGFHRIVFLVYKQPMGRIEFKEKLLSYKARDSERANFSTRSFAKKYNLGDPIAVSFFLCQWVKPLPTTTAETWELPTEYWDDGNMLNPDMG